MVFFFFYSIYLLIGSILVFNSTIVLNPEIPVDAYLGFDNAIFMSSIVRHPLLKLFMYPIYIVAKCIYICFQLKAATFFYIIVLNYLVSSSIIFIFRYLREIIELPIKNCLLIILFYGFFSTNLVLSFTIESYPFSLFSLSIFTYIYTRSLVKKYDLPTYFYILSSIVIGGITITNILKTFIPGILKNKKKSWLKLSVLPLLLVLVAYAFSFKYIKKSLLHFISFIPDNLTISEYTEKLISLSWGSNILFSSLYVNKTPALTSILENTYEYVPQYIYSLFLLAMIILSMIVNYKNKAVKFLALAFLIDVVIHAVFKVGITEGYIYGGNWIFVIPLLIGWLYHSFIYKKKESSILILNISLLLCTIILIVNNTIRMVEFIDLAIKNFKI